MNRYFIRYEFENIDEQETDYESEDGAIVDAESQEQAETYLLEYSLSYFSLEQLETVKIKSVKFMGEVPDERQLRFAI
jgi:hypothetical protein